MKYVMLALLFASPSAFAGECVDILNNAKNAYQAISLSSGCKTYLDTPGAKNKAGVVWNCGSSASEIGSARGIKDQACNKPACKTECPSACGENGLAAFYSNVGSSSCR